MLEQLLHEKEIDILCITETFLNTNCMNYNFLNHDFFRSDRLNKTGGGVAILVNRKLKAKSVCLNFQFTNIECIHVRIQLNHLPCINTICLYRPPNYSSSAINNDMKDLKKLILSLDSNRMNFMLGDFNMRTNALQDNLNSLLDKHNYQQVVKIPTRKESILDLIIASKLANIFNISTWETHFSDHMLVLGDYEYQYTKPKPEFEFRRNYRNIDYYQFGLDVLKIPEKIFTTCEEQFQYIVSNLLNIFDTYAPLKKVKIRPNSEKFYISDESKTLRKQNQIAYSQFKRNIISKAELRFVNKSFKQSIFS